MMHLTELDLARALQQQNEKTRELVGFAFDILSKECKNAMKRPSNIGNDYFSKKASQVYRYADSDIELDVLRESLLALYQWQQLEYPDLKEPHRNYPTLKQLPVLHEKSEPFALCDAVSRTLEDAISHVDMSTEDKWLCSALLLARHVAITSPQKLSKLLTASLDQIHVFPEARFASLLIDNDSRIILDAQSIACLHKLHDESAHSTYCKNLSVIFQSWWVRMHSKYAPDYRELSFSRTLDALSFIERPIASQAYEDLYHPVDDRSFVRLISSKALPIANAKTAKETRHSVKTTEYFAEIGKRHDAYFQIEFSRLAFDAASSSYDSMIIRRLRRFITDFLKVQPDQKRNTRHYKTFRQNILGILDEVSTQEQSCSAITTHIITFCIDLLLHGSNTKEKLSVNSISTYLSTLISFARRAWSDEQALQLAQSSPEALSEQTEIVADAFGDMQAIDQQNTVLRFLQYVHELSPLKLFEPEELSYLGIEVDSVRPHYITPADFDEALASFNAEMNSHERRQFALFAELCYTLGLRKSEALSLNIADINFRAEVVYISRFIKRKSTRAVRSVPLSLLTTQQYNTLEDHIRERDLHDKGELFDHNIISALLPIFLDHLRSHCGNDTLVLHSLRHSAANNMLFQFGMCCYESFCKRGTQYAFLNHQRFSSEQIRTIRLSIEHQGRKADSSLFLLDTVASILGHVSPSVTANSYLHLLDIAFFELNALRTDKIPLSHLMFLSANNNYRFELKKKFQQSENDRNAQQNFIFRSFTRGTKVDLVHRLAKKKNIGRTSHLDTASFSDFLYAVHRYKNLTPDHTTERNLEGFLSLYAQNLSLGFLEDLNSSNYPTWMRLCERITSTEWHSVNRNALDNLQILLKYNEVTDKRSLHQYFRILKTFGLRKLVIHLQTPNATSSQTHSWKKEIEAAGATVFINEDPNIPQIYVKPRPYRLRWSPWTHLSELINVITSYADYLDLRRKELAS